jgi:signal transduction histidine kinase
VNGPAPARGWPRDVAGALLAEAALRGERLASATRIPFCALVLLRFLTIEVDQPPGALASALVVLGAAIAFSVWALVAIQRGRAGPAVLRLSVWLDVVVCALSLLNTLLWPGNMPHPGMLTQPDVGALLLVVFSAGLRLDPRLSLQSGLGAGGACALLLVLERAMYPVLPGYGATQVSFHAISLASVTALAVLMAGRTRRLARQSALASAQVERARQDLQALSRDHHDARSVLSAALLSADLVGDALAGSAGAGPAAGMVRGLREDLRAASDLVRNLGEKTFGQALLLQEREVVSLAPLLPRLLFALRGRHHPLVIDGAFDAALAEGGAVELVGGRAAFERVLANLVDNAVQGDGQRGATRVWLRGEQRGGRWRLVVADDGPGFPAAVLAGTAGGCLSTKASGTGLGLHGVAQLIQASGGAIRFGNGAAGGARVEIELRLAGAEGGKKSCS